MTDISEIVYTIESKNLLVTYRRSLIEKLRKHRTRTFSSFLSSIVYIEQNYADD